MQRNALPIESKIFFVSPKSKFCLRKAGVFLYLDSFSKLDFFPIDGFFPPKKFYMHDFISKKYQAIAEKR